MAELRGDLNTLARTYSYLVESGGADQQQLLDAFSSFVLNGLLDEAADRIYPKLEPKNHTPQVSLVVALVHYKRGEEFAHLLEIPKQGMLPVFLPPVRRQLGLETEQIPLGENFGLEIVTKALEAEQLGDHQSAASLWLESAEREGARNAITRFHRHVWAAKRVGVVPDVDSFKARYRPGSPEIRVIERIGDSEPPPSTVDLRLAALMDEFADYAMTRGDNYTAAVYARLGLLFVPKNQFAAVVLAGALANMGFRNWGEDRFYRKQLDYGGVWSDVLRISYARFLGDRDKITEAKKLLETHFAENPMDIAAALELEELRRSREDFVAAARLCSEIIASNPEPIWEVYHLRGINYERLGEWGKAEADFLRSLEVEPANPYVMNYLAYSWLERGENLKRALTMLRQAQSLAPDDPHIADSYGWALHKNSQTASGLPFLERALNKMPTDPTINEHVGDALAALGKARRASFYWRRAARFSEEADDRKRLAKKLETR